jgi:hypothetical protein
MQAIGINTATNTAIKTVIFITLLLSMLTMSSQSFGYDKPFVLEGPYVGQKPPGSTPNAFAPSGLSKERRYNSCFFTPDIK